jgi:serine/threonine-protein kinase
MLQGRFYEARRTEADIRAAIEHYRVATRLDPHYAFAWSSISLAWNALGATFPDTVPMQPAFAEARTTAGTALALAPGLAAAHLARGNVLNNADLDWRGAEEEFRRALELAPNDGGAKFYLASQLATLGQVEQAVELTRQALATDPLVANSYYFLAGYLQALNRLDEAERAVRKAIALQPRAAAYHAILAGIEVQRGDAPAALTAAQQETEQGWQYIALAFAHQIGGDPPTADAALQTLIDQRAEFAAYQIAEVYAFRKDADNTFAWLDRAWSNRDSAIGFLLYDPFILRYKDDARFAAFCRKVGLPVPGEAGKST